MTLPELIKRIVDAGANTAVVAIVAEAFEAMSRSVTLGHADMADTKADRKRKLDRIRKRKSRKKHRQNGNNAEANDAAQKPGKQRDKKPDVSAGRGSLRCESSFLPSLLSESPSNRESKKETNTRARGTRLSVDAVLSDVDRQFALENGVDPDAAWAEFRDYWTGIPGQRGVKLSWGGTWRNRVRAIGLKNGGRNGPRIDNASRSAPLRGADAVDASIREFQAWNDRRDDDESDPPAGSSVEPDRAA